MINQLGNYSLIFGFIISAILIILTLFSIKVKKTNLEKNIFYLISTQFFFVTFSFVILIYSFIVSDFSNEVVYNHSHTTKPLFYKIAGSWGNHEGSLLLWLLVLTLFILLFYLNSKKLSGNYKTITVLFQEIIICGFYLFIILTSNPFNFLYPTPNEGLGLNPILQDPALAIHPPILYLGYVGTSIIFSSSLSALITKNVNSTWALDIKKWILTSWIFLTIGILIGSIWAYYELGWGGFWFWDPVENVSLMPWLCLTALIHTISVLEKRSILKSWTLILSISTFSLSMSGTFLVRSGILNSVHTFANDPSRGLFILVFLFILLITSITIFFVFSEKENSSINKTYLLSKETAILFNNWFMMFFLSVVFIGTIYPIFLEAITNDKISIGPPFYNKILSPFLVPFLIFMSIGPNLRWIKSKLEKIDTKQIIIFAISVVASLSIIKISNANILFTLFLIFASIYLLLTTTVDLFKKNLKLPQKVSHLAFSIFILSILLNGIFAKEISYNMKVGDEVKFLDNIIKFKSLNSSNEKNYKKLIGEFELTNKQASQFFYPEIRVYNQPNIVTSEAYIKTGIFSDNFIVINLIKDDGYFNVRYQIKPFMIWIWISVSILALGGLISFYTKKYE
tara:strand:+ start:1904 stop:3778 length:1875 start_codon:yes stop_codon:yes gene_type:complete